MDNEVKSKKRFLLITDAWIPQTNGVVTTLKTVLNHLEQRGFAVKVIHPAIFRTFPLPSYPEIRLAFMPKAKLKRIVAEYQPDNVHIATEGPLGIAAKKFFDKSGYRYTTSLHTKFPEYVNKRLPFVKLSWGYAVLKWFHSKATAVMVTTESMKKELVENGFNSNNIVIWGRGVDCDRYQVNPKCQRDQKNPILMYVGRLAVEKNLEAFLNLNITGQKVLVGDGPQRSELESKYLDVEFVGYKYGQELVEQYQRADVFVFPSKSDTFGLVLLEAMACGTPVAAFPVAGPIDVVVNGKTGCLDNDLEVAIAGALKLKRQDARKYAEKQSWQAVAQRLQDQLVSFHGLN